ncbi:MAG: L-seryl-tRNA(Sec) selenium transferase [Bacillota bacterium]|nr:L-seryl-tRNA(Sec) selenium transferase [Bacillota bacterium]
MNKELLRKLPKIDELLESELIMEILSSNMRIVVVDALREAIDIYRQYIIEDKIVNFELKEILDLSLLLIEKKGSNRLKRVVNASGVILHTNLGRAKISKEAAENAMKIAQNYSNLEFDIEMGNRGSRYSHVEELLRAVTGAEAALVVNNNAAAVLLALDTLTKGREAVVSRGQLVEIGGSFRIPDLMSYSGAILKEVGTTNKTHFYDYEQAINENTGVLLRVHTSNFKIIGFTEEVPLEDLVKLGSSKGIPVMEDIGSGTLIDFANYGLNYEPTIQNSIRKGADIVTFSGDKLLGGPQAGVIAGKKQYIDKMKNNPLTRALRIDKMTLAALEVTLKYYLEESEAVKHIPTLSMLLASKEEMRKKALKLGNILKAAASHFEFELEDNFSMVGGGSMPAERICTYVIKVTSSKFTANEIEKALRMNCIPIIIRITGDAAIIDVRTMNDDDFEIVTDAFKRLQDK